MFFYRSKVLTIWIRVIISVHLTFIITVSYSGLDFNRDRDDLRFPGFSWVSTMMICAGVLNIQLCMNGLLASNCQFACGRLVIGVFAIILALTELIWKQWVLFCRTSLSFSLRAIITLNFLFKKLVQETGSRNYFGPSAPQMHPCGFSIPNAQFENSCPKNM